MISTRWINGSLSRQIMIPMDACEPLKEYAWLVDTVRRHQQEKMDLDAAVDAAISEMPDEFVIKPFLMENRAEGTKMSAACGGCSESEFQ